MKHSVFSRQKGMAMIMALGALALIAAVVMEITYRAQVSASVVANRRDSEKAYQLARAAMRWAIFRLQLDSSLDAIPKIEGTNYGGKKDDLTEVQWAVPLPYPFPAGLFGLQGEGATSEPPEGTPLPVVDIGGSFISALSDESAKINLNDVQSGGLAGQRQFSGAALVLENLLLSPRFQSFFRDGDHREVLWAIDDWSDSDSEVNHLGGGIEDAEYQTDDPDLHVKNAPLFSTRELRLLKPISEDLYRELLPFITVYPFDARIPRVSTMLPSPMSKINVNTAPLEIIAALFSRAQLPEPRERLECAQKIVQYRKNVVFRQGVGTADGSFESAVTQLCSLPPPGPGVAIFEPAVKAIIDVRSDVFSVEATGSVGDIEKTIHSIVTRQNPLKPKILFWRVT